MTGTSLSGVPLGQAAAVRNTANSAATGANTFLTLTFDTELFDTDGMYEPGATDRLTFKTPGIYIVTFAAALTANASGDRAVQITTGVALTELSREQTPAATGASDRTFLTTAAIIQAAVGDFVQARVLASVAAVASEVVSPAFPRFSAARVA